MHAWHAVVGTAWPSAGPSSEDETVMQILGLCV